MFGLKKDAGTAVADLPAQEAYQAQILADYQRAARLKDTTLHAAASASRLAVEAEGAYEEARKRLRRVSEGGI